MKTLYVFLISGLLLSCSSLSQKSNSPEKMVGEVVDEADTHDTRHLHSLKFIDQLTKKIFKVVDSPALIKLHHETGKNYLIEAEVEKKSNFLFLQEKLVIKNFRVLKETSEAMPHHAYDETNIRSNNSRLLRTL